MKIDTDKFMTVEQAGALFGANKRAAYRALKRARKAGKEITVVIFGRSLVPASAVETLKKFYYPYYSEAHQANVKKWGSQGGRQKKINLEKAAKK
jgi:selenocysteine lyase/cysteine desulfurase